MIDPLPEGLPVRAGTLSRSGLVTEARLTAWRHEGQYVAVRVPRRQMDEMRPLPQKA